MVSAHWTKEKQTFAKEAKDPAPVVHCLTEHMLGCCPCLSEILSALAQGNSKCTAAENRLWLLWALGIFPQGQVITHPTATESIGTGGPGPVSCDVQHVGTNSRSMFPQAHERKTSRIILHQCCKHYININVMCKLLFPDVSGKHSLKPTATGSLQKCHCQRARCQR